MKSLFGGVARRKAPALLAMVLVFAVAGVAFASPVGTVIRMGITNTITGNYPTSLVGTVSSRVLEVRNQSTYSGSTALRVWSPNGGVPLDLRAKLGQPPMRVNTDVKVPLLNADRVDDYHASVAAAPNTIPVRDGSNAIAANLNGNVNGNASTATNANMLDALDSTAFLNRDGRVAHVAFANGTATELGSPNKVQSVSITVPGSANQRVKVDATVTLYGTTAALELYSLFLAEDGGSISDGFYGAHPAGYYQENQSVSWMFTAAPGTHTYDLIVSTNVDLEYYGASMIAQSIPLLGTGATPASVSTNQSRGAPKGTRPGGR